MSEGKNFLIYVFKPCCFIDILLQFQTFLIHFNQHLKFVIKLHHSFLRSYVVLVRIQHLIDFTWLCQYYLCQQLSSFSRKGYFIWQNLFLYDFLSCDFLYSHLGFGSSAMNFLWDSHASQICSADELHLHIGTSRWLDKRSYLYLLLLTLTVHE